VSEIGSGSATPDAIHKAPVRRVEIQDAQRLGPRIAESVRRPARSREEGAGACTPRSIVCEELDLTLQHVERVDVVVMGVRVDALELRQERQFEHGELLQIGFDQEAAGVVLDELALTGAAQDCVVEWAPAVGRRLELVEVRAAAADVIAEAHRRRVQVEEERGRVARVPKRVDDVGRSRGNRSRGSGDRLKLRPERELELALQHVEGIGVQPVDVRVGPLLARLVAEPRDDQVVELGEDAQRPLRAVRDGLAFAGR
jgi:hypothetical protein